MKILSSLLIRILLIVPIMLTLCVSLNAAEMRAPTNTAITSTKIICADFLDKLNRKPQNLEFIGCKKIDLSGDSALESRYRIKGSYAKKVEAIFVQTAHMPELVRNCCAWESISRNPKKMPYGVYKSGGNSYMVEMSSGETLVTDWNDIPYFYVTVTIYEERF